MSESKKIKTRQVELTKKLQKITSMNELKNILKTSKEQNKKLTDEVRELRDRVQAIMNNYKVNLDEKVSIKPQNQKQDIQYKELLQLKKELKTKYSRMKVLKQQISLKKNSKIEQAEFNKMNNLNSILSTQKTIKELTKQIKDLQQTNKKLQKTFDSTKKNQNVNQPKIQQLQQQNKSLKTKITELRKYGYEKQYQSIAVQTTLIANKKKMKQMEARKSMFDLKNTSMPDKNQMLGLVDSLKKEVAGLKKEVLTIQESKTNEENQQKKRRNQLYNHNKEQLKRLKQIDIQKCKLEQQNNLWRKKWNDICRAIELHNKKIKKIPMQTQMTEYVDPKPLRRDYAGILNKYRYEDRIILQENKTAKIIGMMIYEIQKGIVAMQAFYNNGERTYLPIPQHFIERCRVTKIQCSQSDFFKLFKIKYNSIDNKITKVEIRSNKNIKYQYGEKKQWSDLTEGDTIYGFDIGVKQYPVCAFGSYNFHKGYWLLEGFGVQINELTQ